jgi:hypothetical protein
VVRRATRDTSAVVPSIISSACAAENLALIPL